jgi:hypothetical protein
MVAVVVQDALTGQILWVGRLQADAPKLIAETGDLEAHGVAPGQALSVRHISSCGEGLIIHVEGLSTRMQLDSLPPDAGYPPSEPPFVSRPSATAPALDDSGSWPRAKSSPPLSPPDLESQVCAFEQLLLTQTPGVLAEQGTRLLRELLAMLHSAGARRTDAHDEPQSE